jgi:hypothetical protein
MLRREYHSSPPPSTAVITEPPPTGRDVSELLRLYSRTQLECFGLSWNFFSFRMNMQRIARSLGSKAGSFIGGSFKIAFDNSLKFFQPLVETSKGKPPQWLTIHNGMGEARIAPDLPLPSISDAVFSAHARLFDEIPGKRTKISVVLHSTATIEEKQLLLEDFLQSEKEKVQAEKEKVQSEKQKVQMQDSLIRKLEQEIQAIKSERDFLKGTLDARNILEKYEKLFKEKHLTRAQNWKKHLDRTPALNMRLQECGRDIIWHEKVVDIYKHLSERVHTDTSRLGGGRFLVMIRKNLPEIDVCFIQAVSEQMYGDHVTVNAEADAQNTL